MTKLTEVLDRVARQVSLDEPTAWLNATEKEYKEIRDDFLLETISDIQDRVELPSPIAARVSLSSGIANADESETFNLPDDFLRMQRDDLAVYDSQQDRPAVPVKSDGEWLALTDLGASGVVKYYRLNYSFDSDGEEAFQIQVYPAPADDVLTVSYISNVWLRNSGLFYKSAFTDPDDALIFPRRLVESGIVWRWRERKGLPFEAKHNEYETQIARLANDRRGRRVVDMSGQRQDVRWQDLVPSFIPSS